MKLAAKKDVLYLEVRAARTSKEAVDDDALTQESSGFWIVVARLLIQALWARMRPGLVEHDASL